MNKPRLHPRHPQPPALTSYAVGSKGCRLTLRPLSLLSRLPREERLPREAPPADRRESLDTSLSLPLSDASDDTLPERLADSGGRSRDALPDRGLCAVDDDPTGVRDRDRDAAAARPRDDDDDAPPSVPAVAGRREDVVEPVPRLRLVVRPLVLPRPLVLVRLAVADAAPLASASCRVRSRHCSRSVC